MNIQHIRYFLALCETMNFTMAAERCNVAQSALSRAIKQLEEEVGGQLVRRERNRNALTDLGLLMKPRFQRIISELSEARHQARQFLTLEKSTLTAGVLCTIGPTRLAGVLVHFAQAHPDASLQLHEAVPAVLAAKLKAGDIDVALTSSPDGFSEEFSVEPLYRERFVVAFPLGHRFSRLTSVTLSETVEECYLHRLNCEYDARFDEIIATQNLQQRIGLASEREDWIQNMIAGGMGIAFVPEFSALAPGVDTRPLIQPEVWREVCLVRRRGAPQGLGLERFMRVLRKYPFPASRFGEMETTASHAARAKGVSRNESSPRQS